MNLARHQSSRRCRAAARYAIVSALGLFPAVAQALGGPCGAAGSGDCCVENGTPGCEDAACCADVCAADSFCCTGIWDATCAALADTICAPGTCGSVCPGEGDCCVENGTPSCSDATCCDTVCASDPFCCAVGTNGIWDATCAAAAALLCAPGTCPGACPGEGDCCVENGSPGCDDAACCGTVCAADPLCCDTNGIWDAGCASLAASLCAPGTCPDACPGDGDCCADNGTPGCEDEACCDTVCAADPFCCAVGTNGVWDETCAAAALTLCTPGTCPGVCPGTGDCCVENGSPGCDDAACCGTVCAADPLCCDTNGIWDAGCASLAASLCAPETCPGACPGEGDCCVENGSPGCDDAACCGTVCAADPLCCDTNGIWDAGCASLAASLCAPGTCPGACPGEGDCCVENGTPGCDDATCCDTVCASDPFCCAVGTNGVWDETCAAAALTLCMPGTCPGACPGTGDCCVENGSPGCDDAACCGTVCAADPLCCDTNGIWDAGCASLAASLCAPGTCPGACPGEGDCCFENGTPGCDDPACCATVCAADPFCCAIGTNGAWDAGCAALAASLCAPGTCPDACPGTGDCCVDNGTPGCDDSSCCAAVCSVDSFCCDTIWDAPCVMQAAMFCTCGMPGGGDFDGDFDVDLDDHIKFVECLAGSDMSPSPTPPIPAQKCLDVFDFDGDTDVDLVDFAALTRVFGS